MTDMVSNVHIHNNVIIKGKNIYKRGKKERGKKLLRVFFWSYLSNVCVPQRGNDAADPE